MITDIILMAEPQQKTLEVISLHPDLMVEVAAVLDCFQDKQTADLFWKPVEQALDSQITISFDGYILVEQKKVWLGITVSPFSEGRVIWVGRDISHRKQIEAELKYRLEFENLITNISTQFINLKSQEIDSGINSALAAIGEFAKVDRSYVFQFNRDGKTISNTHEWCAKGIRPHFEKMQNVPLEYFGALLQDLKQLKVVQSPQVHEQSSYITQSLQSIIYVPMVSQNKLLGFVGFDQLRMVVHWSEDLIALLRIAGEMLAHVLERKRAEEERQQAEWSLRESEERFRQLAEKIDSVFWIKDLQKRDIIYVSPAYQQIWGRSCESLYKHPQVFVESIHPEDRDRAQQAFFQHIDGHYDQEYRILRPDGQERWIHDRAFPICNREGTVYRLVGIAEDISDRKVIEQMKDEFISVMSHEIRTPLSAIQGTLKLLQTGKLGQLNSQGENLLNIAQRNTHRLSYLIDNIFELKRLKLGQIQFQFQPCDATDLVKQCLTLFPENNRSQFILTVSKTISQSAPILWVDPYYFRQVLFHLLENAIKFSPPQSPIQIQLSVKKRTLCFKITDQGCGISEQHLDKVFTHFYQVDSSDTRHSGGTGLGLAICQEIVQKHGGKIWLKSQLG